MWHGRLRGEGCDMTYRFHPTTVTHVVGMCRPSSDNQLRQMLDDL